MNKATIIMLLAVALAIGAMQTALAADGWFNGAKVDLVFANANGESRMNKDKPEAAERRRGKLRLHSTNAHFGL